MRAYDSRDDELYWKSVKPTKALRKATMDLLDSFSRDALLYFLRIAILILGYIVLRPLIEACFRRVMTPQERVEKLQKRHRAETQKSLADELLVESDNEELEENTHDHDPDRNSTSKDEWGGTLRNRQKARFMEAWEEEQARLAEEEDLRELEDILED